MNLKERFYTLSEQLISQQSAPEVVFAEFADLLFHNASLEFQHESYRLTELEFYFHSDFHPDPYVHCADRQQLAGHWYFHRFGKAGTIKEGTWKGVDLTFGKPEVFGGILIRGLRTAEGKYISGPCKTVNYFLNICALTKAREFAAEAEGEAFGNPVLQLKSTPSDSRQIISTRRIGLSSPADDPLKLHYRQKAYRFITDIMQAHAFPEKLRALWEAYRQGMIEQTAFKKALGYQPDLARLARKYGAEA